MTPSAALLDQLRWLAQNTQLLERVIGGDAEIDDGDRLALAMCAKSVHDAYAHSEVVARRIWYASAERQPQRFTHDDH